MEVNVSQSGTSLGLHKCWSDIPKYLQEVNRHKKWSSLLITYMHTRNVHVSAVQCKMNCFSLGAKWKWNSPFIVLCTVTLRTYAVLLMVYFAVFFIYWNPSLCRWFMTCVFASIKEAEYKKPLWRFTVSVQIIWRPPCALTPRQRPWVK